MAGKVVLVDTSILIDYYRKTDKNNSVWVALVTQPKQGCYRVLYAKFICILRIVEGKIKEFWVEYDNLNGLIQLGH